MKTVVSARASRYYFDVSTATARPFVAFAEQHGLQLPQVCVPWLVTVWEVRHRRRDDRTAWNSTRVRRLAVLPDSYDLPAFRRWWRPQSYPLLLARRDWVHHGLTHGLDQIQKASLDGIASSSHCLL